MKTSIVIAGILLLAITACSKNNEQTQPDYSNTQLKKQPLNNIKQALKGRWQHHYDSTFGFAGWTVHAATNRFISFLDNDTVKIESNGVITVYAKAEYIWSQSYLDGDSAYQVTVPGLVYWIPDRIFNDTLKLDAFPNLHYLTRKP